MDETLTPPPRCARTPRHVVIRVLSVMALMLAGRAGDGGVHNEGGSATTYRDSSQRGPVSGVGIEGQDIVAMTDAMMRDLLQVPLLAAAATPPRVINDAAHFRNDRSQRIDRNLIADRLRMGLARAAKGRLAFVGCISTLDSRDNTTGMTERATQLVFDTIDVETRLSIWRDRYSVTKAAADSVVYR
ncbi:MAG: penicillin-binding protein activator LpoB [Pseudomonadota bacterium]|nr:penicillin-binding protein activator LpoB [Pseudomonadota bacterium]